MKAAVGDRIVVRSTHVDEPGKFGEVIEVRSDDGSPPYLVRWDDGHEALMFPGHDAVLEHQQASPESSSG